jgi:hypothetical protein
MGSQKVKGIVTPAKTGVQNVGKQPASGFRPE